MSFGIFSIWESLWIFANPSLDDALINYIFIFEKPHQLADFVASHFLPTLSFKQRMLEEADCAKRVAAINVFLEDEIENYSRMIQTNSHLFVSIPRSQMH